MRRGQNLAGFQEKVPNSFSVHTYFQELGLFLEDGC
jgi:hypothetical protein